MTRLIDADELKEWMANWLKMDHYYHPYARNNIPINELEDIVERVPTVDAVPVRHGKWMVTPVYIKCSECGESFMLIPQNYCPNCGARMDEE